MPTEQPVVERLGQVGRGAEGRHQEAWNEGVRRGTVDGTHHEGAHGGCSVGINTIEGTDGGFIPDHGCTGRWWVGAEVERRCHARQFTVKENGCTVARGQTKRTVKGVARYGWVEVNVISSFNKPPESTKVEAVLEVAAVEWVLSTEGGVDEQRSGHVAATTEENHGKGRCIGDPSSSPSCNRTVRGGVHAVGGHGTGGVHGKEVAHAEFGSRFAHFKQAGDGVVARNAEEHGHGGCVVHGDAEISQSCRSVNSLTGGIKHPVVITATEGSEGHPDASAHGPVSSDGGLKVGRRGVEHGRVLPKGCSSHGAAVGHVVHAHDGG